MTLRQMANTVRNHVVDGLNGQGSISFSIEQLQDEIITTTSKLIMQYTAQGIITAEQLSQRIDGIRVECKDISATCAVASYVNAPHFTVPDINRGIINPVTFLGTMDSKMVFKVYYDRDFRFHEYRLATAHLPFAWISSSPNIEGLYDVYLFNLGKYNNLQYISIDAVFDNPYDILNTEFHEQFSVSEFYAPLILQKEVVDTLTREYVEYYRKLHMQKPANTQQG